MPHVLLTGASGGIGAAIADTLLAIGYQLTVLGRDQDALLPLGSRGAEIIVADLARPAALGAAQRARARDLRERDPWDAGGTALVGLHRQQGGTA
jgi:uncharacterized protein YbjT (DUF2867 family)